MLGSPIPLQETDRVVQVSDLAGQLFDGYNSADNSQIVSSVVKIELATKARWRESKNISEKTFLFKHEDPPNQHLYLVKSGEFLAEFTIPGDKTYPISTFRPGDWFGIMEPLNIANWQLDDLDSPVIYNNASSISYSRDASVICISWDDFVKFGIKKSQALQFNLYRELALVVRRSLSARLRKDFREWTVKRLIKRLNELHARHGYKDEIFIDVNITALAKELNVTRDTLYKMLEQLGLQAVEHKYRWYTINNWDWVVLRK